MKLDSFSRSLLDNLSAGLMVLDESGQVSLFNQTAGELTGLSAAHVEGRHRSSLPEGLGVLLDEHQTTVAYERADREQLYLDKKISHIFMDGFGAATVIMFNDTTDLVRARLEMENHLLETAETKDLMEEQAATLAMTLAEVEEKTEIIENQHRKMMHELEMAGELQKSMLPEIYQSFNGVNLASKHYPSIGIGGDLYDVVDMGQGLTGFVIADVSGHGVAAALVASMFKMSFHTHAANVASPKILFHMLNELMNPLLAEDYITSFYLIVDREQSTITYSNAGHPAPLFYQHETGEIIELDTEGYFIGMFENGGYDEKTLAIAEGDQLLLYTDCIIEMTDAAGQEFGRARLKQLFAETIANYQGQEAIDYIEARSRAFNAAENFDDDFTVLLLEFSARAKSSHPARSDENPHGGEFEEF